MRLSTADDGAGNPLSDPYRQSAASSSTAALATATSMASSSMTVTSMSAASMAVAAPAGFGSLSSTDYSSTASPQHRPSVDALDASTNPRQMHLTRQLQTTPTDHTATILILPISTLTMTHRRLMGQCEMQILTLPSMLGLRVPPSNHYPTTVPSLQILRRGLIGHCNSQPSMMPSTAALDRNSSANSLLATILNPNNDTACKYICLFTGQQTLQVLI